MKERGIAFLAWLWLLLKSIWILLIIGAAAGVLGNMAYSYFTTGMVPFTDPRTLTLISWLSTHWLPITIIFLAVLALTLGAYLAHRYQEREGQRKRQAHDDALVDVAKGVVEMGMGVRTELEEWKARPAGSPPTPASAAPTDQEAIPPLPIWNVPYRRNPFFTGREEILNQLHDNLTKNKSAALTQPQAISGLGGIGKTQTAVEYAYRYGGEYSSVLWVNAASRDAIISSMLELATLLKLPERQEQDQNIVVAAVKSWLATQDSWLLIFDNADDLSLAEDYLPPGKKGHLLLTTRAHAPGTFATKIEVEKMDLQNGTLFLLRRARVLAPDDPLERAGATDRTAADAIVQEMDGLPLALDQAGAYIEETGCSIASYLEQYRKQQPKLLQRRGGTGKEYPKSVATTWSLSFEQVEKLDPGAADLLRFCAFLAPDAIPEKLIVDGASKLGPRLQPIAHDPSLLDEALGTLLRFSLVKRNREEYTISVHRLVQAVLRTSMKSRTQRQWAERTVKAIGQAFPYVEFTTWPYCQGLLPHAQACAALIDQWGFAFSEAGRLCNKVGLYLMARARYDEAEVFYRRAIAIGEKTLGPEDPVLATRLNNLASLYREQGKYEEAEPLFKHAIAIGEKTLGPEHPGLAIDLNSLALLYEGEGKYEEAEPLLKRAIAIGEKALGKEHPDLATWLNNLATLYSDQGKYEEAELLLQRALAIDENALGPEHPGLAIDLHNLAMLYKGQGQYAEAEQLFKRALAIYEQKFGPAHPGTLTIRESYNDLLRKMK